MGGEARVEITAADDIVIARQRGRALAGRLGFSGSEATLIAAAIGEVARNIIKHAKQGEMVLESIEHGRRRGIQVIARDEGPGIPEVHQEAVQHGYTGRNGAGAGLLGVKWLMDEFDVVSRSGEGTVITMKKWVNQPVKHAYQG